MKEFFKKLNLYEKLYLILGPLIVILSFVLSSVLTGEKSWLSLFCSLCGTIAFFCVAKGFFIAPILCIINSIMYIILSLTQKYYGEVILSLFTGIINIFAIVSWLKNRNIKDKLTVQVNKIKTAEYIAIFPISAVLTVGFYFMLVAFNTNQPIVGAISMILSLVADYMSLRRSPYYAIGFIINDIVVIVLWCFTIKSSGLEFIPLILGFIVYLVNDIYGLVNWNLMKKKQLKDSVETNGENFALTESVVGDVKLNSEKTENKYDDTDESDLKREKEKP